MFSNGKSYKPIDQEVSTISSIHHDGQKINLLGIVLHKSLVKKVENKENQQPCRGVFSFVLRDNISTWINITYWGAFKTVSETAAAFSLGDVLLVLQGQVKNKEEDSYENVYMFQTPVKFSITLYEGKSTILPYRCENKTQTNRLRTELLCPPEYHLSLKQVVQHMHSLATSLNQSNNLDGSSAQQQKQPLQLFNFFAAVADVGEPKTVMVNNRPSKRALDVVGIATIEGGGGSAQRVVQKCEITLIDETCGSFPMILWNEELIAFALHLWKAKTTVLSVVDCPVRYDNYRRGVIAVPNDRTGFITSPNCEEANRLGQYAKYSGWSPITGAMSSADGSFGDQPGRSSSLRSQFSQPLPTAFGRIPAEIENVALGGIHTVLTVEDILKGKVNSGFGIVFAMITKLAIDGDDIMRMVRLSCSNCQRRMHTVSTDGSPNSQSNAKSQGSQWGDRWLTDSTPNSLFMCSTPDCPLAGQRFTPLDQKHIVMEYNLFLNLSDHTGTYTRCVFTNTASEKLFAKPAREFMQLSPNVRTCLKWTLLLTRFKVYFWMRQPGFDQPNPYLSVLACEVPNPFEVYSSLKAAGQ